MDIEYNILHDKSLPMVFVGDTLHNHSLYKYFKNQRSCQHLRLEDVMEYDDDWFARHQVMAVVTNVIFKKTLADTLGARPVQWFSACSRYTILHQNLKIGYNTLINSYNVFYDDCKIGNHCTITNHVMLSHQVTVGDMCHISPFTYVCFTELQQGVILGVRSSCPGKPHNPIVIAPWSNILMESRITRSLTESGTYAGNRKYNDERSLDVKIL